LTSAQQIAHGQSSHPIGKSKRLCREDPPSAKQLYLWLMGEYSVGDALKKFLSQSKLKGSVQALQIAEVWEKIMGKTIARYTDKIQIHGQTLFIETTVAPLRQELLYKKEKIIQLVNEALGEQAVKEVVIK
jgi:predicted nucleic acid-binding Zn ribbon protein